ncbi:MAG: Uma2 family endonuclease [Bryobacteraceae bacterium]|nr:Uma2 family endonuclease [Bryobacteraceae bacterium]
MPFALQLETIPPQPPPRLRKFTREECEFLLDHGFFAGERYELVDGELINKLGQKPPHAFAISMLSVTLVQQFGRRIRLQLPIDVAPEDNPSSEPEPDAVVTHAGVDLAQRTPGPSDIAWLIEVSDTTLRFDLTTKADLYARAGIADYWVLDLNNRRMIVHREPLAGAYRSVTVYESHEPVAPLVEPGLRFTFPDLTA